MRPRWTRTRAGGAIWVPWLPHSTRLLQGDRREATMTKMGCLSLAFSLLAVASVQAIPAALAQGAGGERPISATTTGDWSVQVVTESGGQPSHDDRSSREYRDH